MSIWDHYDELDKKYADIGFVLCETDKIYTLSWRDSTGRWNSIDVDEEKFERGYVEDVVTRMPRQVGDIVFTSTAQIETDENGDYPEKLNFTGIGDLIVSGDACQHDWVDNGFHGSKKWCRHCDQDMP